MTPQAGHNIAADKLKSLIERIERLESEKRDIAETIKDVFAEAKGDGFCAKTMRQIIKLRKAKAHEREEQETLLYVYKKALGMQGDLFE